MNFSKDFCEHLKKVVPELGEANDLHIVCSDDDSAMVAAGYVVPAERWRSFTKRWQAKHPEDSVGLG